MEKTPLIIDAEGLKCPLPVLKLQKALEPLVRGTVVEVKATDENALTDIPAICRADGHTVERTDQKDGVFIFRIQKG